LTCGGLKLFLKTAKKQSAGKDTACMFRQTGIAAFCGSGFDRLFHPDKMRSRGILLVGVYNRVQYDRTQWYSVSDEVMALYAGRFQKEGREEGGEERREAPEGEAGREAAEEGAASRPPGPMDVGKVPLPCAPEGRWMWEKSQMEVRNFPNGSAKNHVTIQSR
jgi:hypothetical protein